MISAVPSGQVTLREGEFLRRRQANREYLLSLKNENLLLNFETEACRYWGRAVPLDAHTGWESPVCQLRGHFLGHWLSAAALDYRQTKDPYLKGKAEAIIDELEQCQIDNGDGWVAPIPEKYLDRIAAGKSVWAPQYTIHKVFMGLVDAYLYLGSQKALDIADRFADWFVQWSGRFSREKFNDILDVETGGMLEIWAELYHITGDSKYKTLLARYDRPRLFEPLLQGGDPLTNMHANTTIPEILGCARAYEVTGEERYLAIAKAYWRCAVEDRGCLVTGGQTSGEVWMPKNQMKYRLGDKNQEHCTVYNMMRLAEFLFRHEGDPKYMQYIEYNLYNGVFAQTYFREYNLTGGEKYKDKGLLTYFLPMKAGLHKDWAGETDSFFCCHGTMVQANATLDKGLYYQEDGTLYLCQYVDSDVRARIGKTPLSLSLRRDSMSGSPLTSSDIAGQQSLSDVTSTYASMPDFVKYDLTLSLPEPTEFILALRIPEWISGEASIYVNGTLAARTKDSDKFHRLKSAWKNGDTVTILFPIGVTFVPLPDDPSVGAFRYGPYALCGVCAEERILHVKGNPADEIERENEREWGAWRYFFRTKHQEPVVTLLRLCDIGYEPMQIYFRVDRS